VLRRVKLLLGKLSRAQQSDRSAFHNQLAGWQSVSEKSTRCATEQVSAPSYPQETVIRQGACRQRFSRLRLETADTVFAAQDYCLA
jgi:hypothetical protein